MKWLIIVPLALIALAVLVFAGVVGFLILYDRYVHWSLRRMLDKNERLAMAEFAAALQTPDWAALRRFLQRAVPSILQQAYADTAFISKTYALGGQSLHFFPIRKMSEAGLLVFDNTYFPFAEFGDEDLLLKAGRVEPNAVYQYRESNESDGAFVEVFPSLEALFAELDFVAGRTGVNARAASK